MRIRWKLLSLLLLIALIPLVVVTTFTWVRMRQLGADVGRQSAETLVQNVKDQLQLFVADRAALLHRELMIITLAIRAQADVVDRCLAIEDPPDTPVLFSKDFAAMTADSPGITVSDRFMTITPDGRRERLPHSFEQPVFVLAPGVKREAVAGDIRRLSLAMQECRQLFDDTVPREDERRFSFWHFTSLENGIHVCYPGHANYPADYDPRRRDWYRDTRDRASRPDFTGKPVWSLPYMDASTSEVVMSVSLPVSRPNGAFAGATALDVSVAELASYGSFARIPGSLAQVVLWGKRKDIEDIVAGRDYDFQPFSDEERTQLLARVDEIGMLVVAEPTDPAGGVRWQMPTAALWLDSDDPALDDMKRDMLRRQSGVREIQYKGKRCLWGYGRILQQACLIVIVPYDKILAEAKKAEGRVRESTRAQLVLSLTIFAVAVAVVVVVAFLSSRAVTRPMRRLVRAATRIANGDLRAKVDVRSQDEIGELGQTFNDMIPKLQEHVQMEQSLAVAQEVQQSLLPAEPPHVPGLDVASRCDYCDETGGDYLDFIDLSDREPHTLGVAVGDVTGHGIGAALMMANGSALLRGRAEESESLGALMSHLNRHLIRKGIRSRKFITLSYLVINGRTHVVRWTGAGHDPPIVYDANTGAFSSLTGGGIPLGIDATWEYKEYGPRTLGPGHVIIIGTDGIWEARNACDDMFGKDRLCDVIAETHDRPAEAICDAIVDAVVQFRAGHPQEDDITFVVIKTAE